ncbi:unnamed protein product [Prorocentrum cordatum]|uniref:Uncharacterized protein n=1 Tax=Prorocentrum cordatum TaxID=2364126 RepID=A0ABN9YFA5_9DINO|nr:unnamed protein product [Polarella glacialis]
MSFYVPTLRTSTGSTWSRTPLSSKGVVLDGLRRLAAPLALPAGAHTASRRSPSAPTYFATSCAVSCGTHLTTPTLAARGCGGWPCSPRRAPNGAAGARGARTA